MKPIKNKDALRPFGELDTIYYYSVAAEELAASGFLKGKIIATKIIIPNGPSLLKRDSQLAPLTIEELGKGVDESFLKLRTRHNLKDVQDKLTAGQIKLWRYFFPRKMVNLFYATNGEGAGKDIERIFYDFDLGERMTAELARPIVSDFINLAQKDKAFGKLVGAYIIHVMWTGQSFHVYFLLSKKIRYKVYEEFIAFSKNSPEKGYTAKWVAQLQKKFPYVQAGHEKTKGKINIDPSQTPSGKLCRAPFSIHFKDTNEIDGVAIPISIKDLQKNDIVNELQKYTPRNVLAKIELLSKNLR